MFMYVNAKIFQKQKYFQFPAQTLKTKIGYDNIIKICNYTRKKRMDLHINYTANFVKILKFIFSRTHKKLNSKLNRKPGRKLSNINNFQNISK